jgi:hypothetical protein
MIETFRSFAARATSIDLLHFVLIYALRLVRTCTLSLSLYIYIYIIQVLAAAGQLVLIVCSRTKIFGQDREKPKALHADLNLVQT